MKPDNHVIKVMQRKKHVRVGEKINTLLIYREVNESVQEYI